MAAAAAAAAAAFMRSAGRRAVLLRPQARRYSQSNEWVSRNEFNQAKEELMNMIKESNFEHNLKHKEAKFDNELLAAQVSGMKQKVEDSVAFNKVSLDNLQSKNILYVLGLLTALSSGIFGVVRIGQLFNEIYPDGIFSSDDTEE